MENRLKEILEKLEKVAGTEVLYLVGGAVRDLILGKKTRDLDVVGKFDPREVAESFVERWGGKIVNMGREFSFERVVFEGFTLDLSSLNGEDVEKDLLKRDITVNAMGYPLSLYLRKGAIEEMFVIDPAGGLDDLKRRIVRALSSENLRSDPIRFFRLYRFVSTLSFSLDEETRDMIGLCFDCEKPARDRVREELKNILRGRGFFHVMEDPGFYVLSTWYFDLRIDPTVARERVRVLTELARSPEFSSHVEEGRKRGGITRLELALLLSILADPGDLLPAARALVTGLGLGWRDERFLMKLCKFSELPPQEDPGEKVSSEFLLECGEEFPFVLLFARSLPVPGWERIMAKKAIKYYAEKKGLIMGRKLPWKSAEVLRLAKRKGGNVGELMKKLRLAALEGHVRSHAEAVEMVERLMNEEGET